MRSPRNPVAPGRDDGVQTYVWKGIADVPAASADGRGVA